MEQIQTEIAKQIKQKEHVTVESASFFNEDSNSYPTSFPDGENNIVVARGEKINSIHFSGKKTKEPHIHIWFNDGTHINFKISKKSFSKVY